MSEQELRLKTDYVPPPGGPRIEKSGSTRGEPEEDVPAAAVACARPRHPAQDILEDDPWKLAAGFDLGKLPRHEIERILPGWTYTIDNRPSNGSWYFPPGSAGNLSEPMRHKFVERALLGRLLYPETIKVVVRGDPARLLGVRPGSVAPLGSPPPLRPRSVSPSLPHSLAACPAFPPLSLSLSLSLPLTRETSDSAPKTIIFPRPSPSPLNS